MSLWREYAAYWAGTVPVRVLGVGLVVATYRPWASGHSALGTTVFVCGALFAAWAAPGVDARPALASSYWAHRLARHRTTVLACVAVTFAALGEPGVWEGACAAVLLVGYLAASDAWSVGVTAVRGRGRVWGEALGALAGAGVVLAAAAVPVSGGGVGAGRLLAVVVVGGGVIGGLVVWRGRG
ncbi:hypothetical protein [Streptomyces sp. NPDC052225]|uniref:hypothetical protein n=1 Tax=Streptomyces sp. NPDC052225 TaxID=3154949 RepID=UPI003414CAF5